MQAELSIRYVFFGSPEMHFTGHIFAHRLQPTHLEASKRGWLDFKGAGTVFEINFRQILTPKEIQASHGPN